MIENGLESLKPEQLKLVELRYLNKDKKTWIEIGMTLGMDKDTCSKVKNRNINHLIGFIFSTTNTSNF